MPSGDEQGSDDTPPHALGKRKHVRSAYWHLMINQTLMTSWTLMTSLHALSKKLISIPTIAVTMTPLICNPRNKYGHEHQPPYSTILSSIQTRRDVQVAVNGWVSILGPVEDWPTVFHFRYEVACGKITVQAVDKFLEGVERHARDILKRLRE